LLALSQRPPERFDSAAVAVEQHTQKVDRIHPAPASSFEQQDFNLGIVLFFLLLAASSNFYWLISDLFNPEYFVLKALQFVK